MSSLLYVFPLIGGYIGEKFGYTLTITVGFIVAFLGFIFLSITFEHLMYFGIAFFVAGNAFIIPNINALIGLHYAEDSALRNSGYTLYFLIYNIGFLISPVAAGYINLEGANFVFIMSAVNIIIAFIIFLLGVTKKEGGRVISILPQVNYSFFNRFWLVILFSCGLIFSAFFLLQQENFNDKFLLVLMLFVLIGVFFSARKHKKGAKLKMLAFLFLCILSIAFWSLYMLTPYFLTLFISQNINRNIFGFILPASCYYSLDAFFVILFGFFFSWLWRYCAVRKKDISVSAKLAGSLLSIGIGYLILVLGVIFANSHTHLINSLWIILSYGFIAVGELLISPIALAMVGILMPKGQEGLGMGIWQAFMGLSAIISGFLANFVNPPGQGDPFITNTLYLNAFLKMGISTLTIGITVFLFIPKIKKFLNL